LVAKEALRDLSNDATGLPRGDHDGLLEKRWEICQWCHGFFPWFFTVWARS